MVYLRNQYKNCSSYQNGKISASEFLNIPLWFEDDDQIDSEKFNRPAKLKIALAKLFAVQKDNARSTEFQDTQLHDTIEEEPSPEDAEIDAYKGEDLESQEEEASRISAIEKNTEDVAAAVEEENAESDVLVPESTANPEGSSETSITRPQTAPQPEETEEEIKHCTGAGAHILGDHDLFDIEDLRDVDVDSFLMMCTLDNENSKYGFEKAFALCGDDSKLSLHEICRLCNYWFYLVPESHRDTTAPRNIYPEVFMRNSFLTSRTSLHVPLRMMNPGK